MACDWHKELESVVFSSPKPDKFSKCHFNFIKVCTCVLVGTFALVFQAWHILMTKLFIRLLKLETLTFGSHTGACRERQSGGTDLALAESGTSECKLFSICFTLQNKVPAPSKITVIWVPGCSRYIIIHVDRTFASTVATGGCVWRGWPVCSWFTPVSRRFITWHWH